MNDIDRRSALTLLGALSLAACGGGGGSDTTAAAPAPVPAPAPAPAPAPTPAPAPGTGYGNFAAASLGVGANTNGAVAFPADNAWNRDISGDAVDPNSAALIASIGLNTGLRGAQKILRKLLLAGVVDGKLLRRHGEQGAELQCFLCVNCHVTRFL